MDRQTKRNKSDSCIIWITEKNSIFMNYLGDRTHLKQMTGI
uniref:Uncharacterized protein n=1 Tax=Rhizophora mucronata TaxID=61149 RepID=A0A2P2QZ28_RHIMU